MGLIIVKISNWLIAQEQDREQKSLTSVTDWPASVHLLRFQNQETEAAAVARAIKAEVEAGTPAEEILVLVKSDPHGYIADAIERALELLSEHIYFPRGHRGPAEDEVQDVVAWLVLSISVAEGRVDDLALRTLLQLEDNGIGATRLARVRDLAMEHGLRFHEVLDHIHPGSLAAESLDPVVDAGRALIGKAEQISPRPDEDFNAWLVRVADDLSAGTEIFEYLVQISREITGEVAELEMTIEEEEQGQAKPLAPVDFLGELLTAMAGAPDSAPSHLPGRVTFTTMHGAKGLSADVVFLLQAEDQVIPGTAAGPDFDEARRLLYVSMTRARKRLVITACYRRVGPQRFVGSEEMVTRSLTRFLVDYGSLRRRWQNTYCTLASVVRSRCPRPRVARVGYRV